MDFFPQLSPSMAALFRVAYGLLCLLTFAICVKNWRYFFLNHRYGGYAEDFAGWDWWHTPRAVAITGVVWLICLGGLTAGKFTIVANAVNVCFAYHFFIRLRWKSLLRGMGAPGFMWAWLGLALLAVEVARFASPVAQSVVLWVLQVDFAIIMISAGVSKITSGYFKGEGMEYGLVNPMWCYFSTFLRRIRSDVPFYRFMDHNAWLLQFASGLLMLIPATRTWGATVISLGFVGIAVFIRLGFLCEMVIVGALLLFPPGSWFDAQVTSLIPASWTTPPVEAPSELLSTVLQVIFFTYLAVRLLSTLALWYNFYGRKALPPVLQRAQDFVTNRFGVILWRVFTVDQLNFYINIYALKDGRREPVSHFGRVPDVRWSNVAESITVATLFTTLKYFPNQPQIFRDRILRYVKSLPRHHGDQLLFQYVSIKKENGQFVFPVTAEFHVDRAQGTVAEKTVDGSVSVRATAAVSSAHECATPGSYLTPSLVKT